MFADKLDFLMRLTNTTNTALASVTSFDVSYISRIRSGKRSLPKSLYFIENSSDYFARKIETAGVSDTASDIINSGAPWPDSISSAAILISSWLMEKESNFSGVVHEYLYKSGSNPDLSSSSLNKMGRSKAVSVYYGNSGKRLCLLNAFDYLLAHPKSYRLMVYSDEDLLWFTEDKSFFNEWKTRITALIEHGCTITIITNTERSFEEMSEGIHMWTPLLFSGALKCYCRATPKDTLFSRTLFIAEDAVAITCNSLRLNDYHAVNMLFYEKEAIRSYKEEFDGYIRISVPLFIQYLPTDHEKFIQSLNVFYNSSSDYVLGGSSPSLFSMPDELINRLSRGNNDICIGEAVAQSRAHFEQLIKDGCRITEFLILPDIKSIPAGTLPVLQRIACGSQDLYYTPDEYISHVKNALEFSRRYPNYHLIVAPKRIPKGMFLMVKSGCSMYLGKNSGSEIIVQSYDPSLVDSMMKLLSCLRIPGFNKKLNEHIINDYIKKLSAYRFLDTQEAISPPERC